MRTDHPLAYIAGPLTNGNPLRNLVDAIMTADALWLHGIASVVPHLSLVADAVAPRPYSCWMEGDLEILRRCDVLLRLPGESPGADLEVACAHERGIPVCHSVEAVLDWHASGQ